MSNHSVFEKEEAIIEQFRQLLEQEGMAIESAKTHLHTLLDHYKKLLRQTQQLVKLNDSHANKLHQLNNQLKQYSESLEYTASHDALTGLFNKSTITDIIRKQLEISDFVLIIFDIDHFKTVNDSYGHQTGDKVLSGVAQLANACLDERGYLGRFGGEEFMIVLDETSDAESMEIAHDLRNQMEQAVLAHDGETAISVTISLGVTSVKINESFDEIYDRVDKLLYAAKNNGRNAVVSDLGE